MEIPKDIYWFGLRSMHMKQCSSCGLGTFPSTSSSSMCPGEQTEPSPGAASGPQGGHPDRTHLSSCLNQLCFQPRLAPSLESRALPGLWLLQPDQIHWLGHSLSQ